MAAKLRKVGGLASTCIVAAAGCSFLAHDPLSPPHVRRTACGIGHVGQALEEKLSPEYQVWLADVRHFWHDTQREFADEYHRNANWPRPYTTLAEHAARQPLDLQAENARQHLATLWDFHFDSGTAKLNSMGRRRLQDIVTQTGTLGQIVYVQRTPSPTETDLRIEQVRTEMAQLDLGGVDFDVAEARTNPTMMGGAEASRAMKLITNPPKKDSGNSSFAPGSEYSGASGGGTGNNQ